MSFSVLLFRIPFRKEALDVLNQYNKSSAFVNLTVNPIVHGVGDNLAKVIGSSSVMRTIQAGTFLAILKSVGSAIVADWYFV